MVDPAERTSGPMPADNGYPSTRWRLLIGFFVIGHLWAVVGRPIEFATQGPGGPSPAASALHAPVRGYSEFAYLNHGYAFFAPDPGPSHLARAHLDQGDQSTTETYPDLSEQWPRLLYHRHFMLTEFLHNVYAPPIPGELEKEVAADDRWRRERRRYVAVRNSMRRHIQTTHGLASLDAVRIERVEHRMPFVDEYLEDRLRLNHESLYRVLDDLPPMSGPAGAESRPSVPYAVPPGSEPRRDGPLIVPPGRAQPERREPTP